LEDIISGNLINEIKDKIVYANLPAISLYLDKTISVLVQERLRSKKMIKKYLG